MDKKKHSQGAKGKQPKGTQKLKTKSLKKKGMNYGLLQSQKIKILQK